MASYLIQFELHGIQDYIFDIGLNKSAAKRLKGRSAFIDLVVKNVYQELAKIGKEIEVIIFGGGKFLIFGEFDPDKLESIKNTVEQKIFEKFNGELKTTFGYIEYTEDDNFQNNKKEIEKLSGKEKLKTFDNTTYDKFVRPYGNDGRKIGEVCKGCGKWLVDENNGNILEEYGHKDENESLTDLQQQFSNGICDHCAKDIVLGNFIKSNSSSLDNKNILTFLLPFENDINEKEIKEKAGYITDKDFSNIAENGGYDKLAVLKGDIDDLGSLTEDSDRSQLRNFAEELDNFFQEDLKKLQEDNYKDTYTVYAGGDDFVIIGRWDDIINLSKNLKGIFDRYKESNLNNFLRDINDLHFSVAIELFNPKQKIYGVIDKADDLLDKAKDIDEDKNGVNFLGKVMKYQDFVDLIGLGDEIYNRFNEYVSKGYWQFLLAMVKKKKQRDKFRGKKTDSDSSKNGIQEGKWMFDYKHLLIDSIMRNYVKDEQKKIEFAFLIEDLFELGFYEGIRNKVKNFKNNNKIEGYGDMKYIDKFKRDYLKQLIIYILMKKKDDSKSNEGSSQ